jgi:hypothetical protein
MEISMTEHQPTGQAQELHRLQEEAFFRIEHPPLPSDTDKRVKAISLTVFGSDDKNTLRVIYHLLASSKSLPAWKLGSMWCMRRSTFRAKIWMAERRAWEGESQEDLVRLHILLSSLLELLSDTRGDRTQLRLITAEAVKTMQRVLQIELK